MTAPTAQAAQKLRPGLLLTIQEAAQELRLGETRVRELINMRDLPVVTIGRARRVARKDLEEYVARLRRAS